jgi:hypothetical protein
MYSTATLHLILKLISLHSIYATTFRLLCLIRTLIAPSKAVRLADLTLVASQISTSDQKMIPHIHPLSTSSNFLVLHLPVIA